MTVNDLLKRVKKEDYNKVIVISDGIGWANIDSISIDDSTITLYEEKYPLFSDN